MLEKLNLHLSYTKYLLQQRSAHILSKKKYNQPVRLMVNDRKFPARTVFFSHTKPASSNNPRSFQPQSNRLIVTVDQENAGNIIHQVTWYILSVHNKVISKSRQ